jgi:hypothetical protein
MRAGPAIIQGLLLIGVGPGGVNGVAVNRAAGNVEPSFQAIVSQFGNPAMGDCKDAVLMTPAAQSSDILR